MVRRILANGLVGLAVLVGTQSHRACGVELEKLTYYVQLIRGNDKTVAPESGAHRLGPKVAQKLKPVFKWENYWEINCQKVEIEPGKRARVRMSKDREVEIDLTDAAKRTVVAYQNGKPVSRTTRPSGKSMTIIGGDRDHDSVWFIVVRRDSPTD